MATASQRPQLHIRPAREDDAPMLREIFNEAVEDHLATFDSEPRSIEEQREIVAAAENDPKHPILVAELRNWAAGWASLGPYDSRISLDDIGEVFVYVRRAFRSYGVGRQLMRAIQDEAAHLGYRKLTGRILADNRDSLLLCKATGWREVGRHVAHARHGDVFRDVIVVECAIPFSASPVP